MPDPSALMMLIEFLKRSLMYFVSTSPKSPNNSTKVLDRWSFKYLNSSEWVTMLVNYTESELTSSDPRHGAWQTQQVSLCWPHCRCPAINSLWSNGARGLWVGAYLSYDVSYSCSCRAWLASFFVSLLELHLEALWVFVVSPYGCGDFVVLYAHFVLLDVLDHVLQRHERLDMVVVHDALNKAALIRLVENHGIVPSACMHASKPHQQTSPRARQAFHLAGLSPETESLGSFPGSYL